MHGRPLVQFLPGVQIVSEFLVSEYLDVVSNPCILDTPFRRQELKSGNFSVGHSCIVLARELRFTVLSFGGLE